MAHDTAHFWNTAQNQGIRILNIQAEHLTQLEILPFHHKDPFDRMMISQAIVEDMTVLTKDSKFEPYDIKTLWGE